MVSEWLEGKDTVSGGKNIKENLCSQTNSSNRVVGTGKLANHGNSEVCVQFPKNEVYKNGSSKWIKTSNVRNRKTQDGWKWKKSAKEGTASS